MTELISSRTLVMLTYLLLHRHAPQPRQQIAFLLWPDSTDAQSRTNLRKLLMQLRHTLPNYEAVFAETGQVIQLRVDAPMQADVIQFEDAVARGDAEFAVEVYGGPLLPGYHEDWIDTERQRLSDLFATALDHCVAAHEMARDYAAAIGHAQRRLQLDPLHEPVYRTLMRLHALNQDQSNALRVYQQCRAVLQQELGIAPSPETETSYLQLRAIRTAQPGQLIPGTVSARTTHSLIGRAEEWRRLQQVWRTAYAGHPQCVFIAGEAGIGKTRLAEEMVQWAWRQGIETATARCYAAEGALAYAPIITWLRSRIRRPAAASLGDVWLSEVARLLPELLTEKPGLPSPAPLTESWQRQRLFEALARALLGDGEPVLLLLDDVQWSDQDTLEWLRFLLRFNARARLMLMCTVRNEEVGPEHPLCTFQDLLQREGGLTQIELGPLNATETNLLATEIAGRMPPSDHLAQLYRETEGNPLFVVETMHFQSATPGAQTQRERVPSSIQAVLTRRLGQLTPETREVTSLAATIGREFTLKVLTGASQRSEEALIHSVDELLHRRIIREHVSAAGDSTYDFSHDKIREAAYHSLSHAHRQLLHRRVAEALEQAYATRPEAVSGQLAMHYERAGFIDQAIHNYQQAAQVARKVYANADAIRYYQHAQRLLEDLANPTPALLASALQLYESLGDVLHHVTEYEAARVAYQRAMAGTSIASLNDLARLHCKMGNAYRDQRQYEQAMQAYRAAEDLLGDLNTMPANSDHWPQWIQIQLEVDSLNYWLGRMADSSVILQHLQPILERHGTPIQQAEFFRNQAFRVFRQNRSIATDEVVAYTRASLNAFVQMGDQVHIPAATFGLGFVLLWHGQPEQAEPPLQEALRMAERTGDASLIARCVTYLTLVQRQLGRVEQAHQFVVRSLEAAEAAHMPEYTSLARANAAWIDWRNWNWSGVRENGQLALTQWGQLDAGHASTPFQWTALLPLMAVALHEHDPAEAVEYARTLLAPTLQPMPDALAAALDQAVQAWDTHQQAAACVQLDQSIVLAQQARLL